MTWFMRSDMRRSLTPRLLLQVSVLVAILTIALKTLAWFLTDSISLLSDAMESLVNLAGAGFALLMVRVAQRPADPNHPYGHTKAEYFSSAFEGLLILIAAVAIVWAATSRLFNPQPLQQLGWGLGLSVFSSILNGVLAWLMWDVAKRQRSIALEADARHLITDVWTSAGVVLGLTGVALTDWLVLDPLLAIAVALNILREGLQLIWRSAQGLMDEAVEPEMMVLIQKTLADFEHPRIRFDHMGTRRSGQRLFVNLHMHLPANWSLGRAAALRASVEQALMSAVPGLRVTIELLPTDVETHFDDQRDVI